MSKIMNVGTSSMTIEWFLDRQLGKGLLAANDEERKGHVSSGRLSASILGQPLQWQILKIIGVPEKDIDEYVIRKLMRGRHVEDWLVGEMTKWGCVSEAQKGVEYRGAVGFVDAMVDTSAWDNDLGVIPHEIKSVTNMKFKNISSNREADPQHRLQATMYAMALGSDHYAIDYVAADDYRVLTFLYETESTRASVDRVIDEFNEQLALSAVPVFKAKLKWQEIAQYQNYPDWSKLDPDEIEAKLKGEFPAAYAKLRGEAK